MCLCNFGFTRPIQDSVSVFRLSICPVVSFIDNTTIGTLFSTSSVITLQGYEPDLRSNYPSHSFLLILLSSVGCSLTYSSSMFTDSFRNLHFLSTINHLKKNKKNKNPKFDNFIPSSNISHTEILDSINIFEVCHSIKTFSAFLVNNFTVSTS